VGSKSINAVDSEDSEDAMLGDVPKITKQEEKIWESAKEGIILVAESQLGAFNEQNISENLFSSPGPPRSCLEKPSLVHLGPSFNKEENKDLGTERGQALQFKQSVNALPMQMDVMEQKMKGATRTWKRKDREFSGDSIIVQGGKRMHAYSVSLVLGAQGPEKKKSKSDKVALAEADSQPRQPQ
jgi:hypothetical protein